MLYHLFGCENPGIDPFLVIGQSCKMMKLLASSGRQNPSCRSGQIGGCFLHASYGYAILSCLFSLSILSPDKAEIFTIYLFAGCPYVTGYLCGIRVGSVQYQRMPLCLQKLCHFFLGQTALAYMKMIFFPHQMAPVFGCHAGKNLQSFPGEPFAELTPLCCSCKYNYLFHTLFYPSSAVPMKCIPYRSISGLRSMSP